MSDELKVDIEKIDTATAIIHLVGDVTTFAEKALKDAYHTCDHQCENIIFDFRENDYINSAGIAILISVVTEARKRQQRLLIAVPSVHFQKIFHMVGLQQYTDIYSTLQEATNSLN